MKATVEEIRARFDKDVERFSNLETGQAATIDAPLAMELAGSAAAACTPNARRVLDVGCGAGNYTLKLLQRLPKLDCTLVDLSQPMLDRAVERISEIANGEVVTRQSDIRELELERDSCDIILASAVLHHLRTDDEWRATFQKFFDALRPGGSIWITDLIEHSTAAVQSMMWARFGDYLTDLKDAEYREAVFAYIEKEDTPRPLLFQIDLLRSVGFSEVEILHKISCFAAFGAIKAG